MRPFFLGTDASFQVGPFGRVCLCLWNAVICHVKCQGLLTVEARMTSNRPCWCNCLFLKRKSAFSIAIAMALD